MRKINPEKVPGMMPIIEEFYTIQGEGHNAGKPAYFIRTGGCDLACLWCDSKDAWFHEFHNYVKIIDIIERIQKTSVRTVVVTGGEPLIHNFDEFCESLKSAGIDLMLETSGAYKLSGKWDWICLSPKKQKPPEKEFYNIADELKVIIYNESDLEWAESCAEKVNENCVLYLQPEWSRFNSITAKMVVNYIKKNTKWNISVQIHKFLKIP